MEQQPPPLTPEEMSQFAGMEYAQLGQPQQVKVFGIMHLVFGAYGVLAVLWSLYVALIGNPILKFAGNSPEIQLQTKLESQMFAYTVASTAFMALVTALIIVAGILLLKGRKSARKWSNGYAWLSIATKVINMVATIVYVVPMTTKMMGQSSPGVGAMMGNFEMIMIGSMMVGFLFSIIYPVLSLILLNRPNVKTWFENQPA